MPRASAERKRRLAQERHTSSKPPASDERARRPRPRRRPSGKKPGGQPGHAGHTRAVVERPAGVQSPVPAVGGPCQQPLDGMPGVVVERRQVQDLPAPRWDVTEPQSLAIPCPVGHTVARGVFPDAVPAPVQYGPRVRALAV